VEVELHVTAIIFNGTPAVVIVARDISERKRAEADLARLSVIQRALVHLATDFVNVPMERQDTAIDESLATMGTLIHADRAALYEYDFDRGVMSNTHEWCNAGITPAIGNLQAVPAALFPDWVKAHQRGELVHLPLADPSPNDITLQTTPVPQGIRELIALPLMQGAVCLGFISFDGGREKETWQEEDVALLRVLAELYAHFQARRRAERETLALQKSLTVARDAAQAAAAAKSLFLANMSHEIRTPLNAILGYAQIMERECRNCPTGQRLNAITRSGEHLLELITDLLELVRNDGRIITLAPATFDFLQVLEDVRLMFARPLAAQGVALEVSRTPDVPHYIHADQAKVRQVLVNLVGNAAKFTEKGSVQLSASVSETSTPNGMTLVIDIVDTGCGICEAEQTRIFELFYMAEHNQHTGKGTGLGLPLSRRYAQALGGDVTVTSQPEVGSCFRFTFQARIESGDEAIHACRESIRRLAPDQRVCHILVVDDDPTNCDMLADMLAPVGFAVEIATSAVQALNRLCQPHQIDLVLMDKSMPEMNGYEAIRRLRERPEGRALSIVVVTASGLSDEREHALAAGANGYTSKPVRRENFLHEIARVAGVRYEYERAPVADPSATQPTVLDPTALSRLPAEQRRSLDQALRRGDIRQLRSLVDTIAHDHAGLAAGIRTYVDTYDYDRLRRLLDSAEGDAL
jgi:signal transduction histidine kinase